MGHTGKHIIDPETGLCVICDQDAIQEVTQGRRPRKQYHYTNGNDGSTHRSHNDEAPYAKDRYVYETTDEPEPRYVRKAVYPVPTVRPRRVVYEQPVEEPLVIRRKIVRRDHTPPEEVVIHRRPAPRASTYYYVDDDNQMIPQPRPPAEETPRRFIIRKRQPPPERTVRVIRQTTPPPVRKVPVVRRVVRTPPPPVSEAWHTAPRRHTNSDTQIVEREQRVRRNDHYSPTAPLPPLARPEMFHLASPIERNHQSPLEVPVYTSRSPTPQPTYQEQRSRKPNRIEPVEQRTTPPPQPRVVKRVYKNRPPPDDFGPNENQPHSTRRPINHTPPPKQYQSSPRHTNGNNQNPDQTKNPTIFYIRGTDNYE